MGGEINDLDTTIEDPETGLRVQIKHSEESLITCRQSQKTQTIDRTEANAAYQTDIKNLVSAEALLKKAIKVLKKYYDELAKKIEDAESLLRHREDPNAPET